MKFVDEFRDKALAEKIISNINVLAKRIGCVNPTSVRKGGVNPAFTYCEEKLGVKRSGVNLMEVCGTHTVAVFKSGIKQILPSNVALLSGPGCPVCVTPADLIDKAIFLSRLKGITIATFGDMLRVPGSDSSLEKERSKGADVRVIYSGLDALEFAEKNPDKKIVLFAIGFETTSPGIACVVDQAHRKGVKNFFILSGHRLIPPAMKALLDGKEIKIDGFICPGHVSTIIGSQPYVFIARDYHIPCVVSGFEPLDVLQSVYMLLKQINDNEAKVEIEYRRCVRPEGNPFALKSVFKFFETVDSSWRGLGLIPQSGLKLKKRYACFDAEKEFDFTFCPRRTQKSKACICAEVLRGVKSPPECSLFGRKCTPERPVGPCMVSSEGTCAAYYKYSIPPFEG